LVLREFIATQVSRGIGSSIQNRDVLETESSIKVFERAYGWIKLILGAAAALLAIVSALGLWKATDWWSEVNNAKQVVTDAAEKTRKEITQTSTKAVGEIQAASSKAVAANEASVREAGSLSTDLNRTATRTKSELAKEADSVKTEVASSQVALQGVQKLQPEFDSMRAQLSKATSDLAAQQKEISEEVTDRTITYIFMAHRLSSWLSPGCRHLVVLSGGCPYRDQRGCRGLSIINGSFRRASNHCRPDRSDCTESIAHPVKAQTQTSLREEL
jgi:hypothetical protein